MWGIANKYLTNFLIIQQMKTNQNPNLQII